MDLKHRAQAKIRPVDTEDHERRDNRKAKGCGVLSHQMDYSCIGDLKNSPRVVLVVSNATIAHPPLSHNCRVETHIGE